MQGELKWLFNPDAIQLGLSKGADQPGKLQVDKRKEQ
jgi:hypothetical protein